MSGARPSKLARLLAMVPYFEARPGIKLATAAKDLGVSEATLTEDLNQLFVCGLPGYGPEHLIDIQFWDGYVSVQFAAGMNQSECIIAINNDPQASIFNVAHLGLVGDLYEVLPALMKRIDGDTDGHTGHQTDARTGGFADGEEGLLR